MVMVAKPRGNSNNPKKSGKNKRKNGLASKSSSAITYIAFGLLAFGLVTIVVAASLAWNEYFPREKVLNTSKMAPPDPRIKSFLKDACEVASCHESLTLVGRSLLATKDIDANEYLLEVPRSMQIWDLDALRDRFVRNHLYDARHPKSGNQLSSNAFLAAFIAMQIHNMDGKLPQMRRLDPLRMAYLDTLPKYDDLGYHPVTWDDQYFRNITKFGSASFTSGVWHREMVFSEYRGLSEVSKEFASIVSREDYIAARINVMSRAYNVAVPGPDEELAGQPWGTNELNVFRFMLDRNMIENDAGCRAMIPIADMLNHHPKNNAAHRYNGVNPSKGKFIVETIHPLPTGSEPMVRYGDFPISDLFIRYGFVNGDGSSPTVVSLAFHHTPLNLPLEPEYSQLRNGKSTPAFDDYQRELTRRYIAYDDGYEECVKGPEHDPEASELKKLKSDHLVKIANNPKRWTMRLPPRSDRSLPTPTIDIPITDYPPQFEEKHLKPDAFDLSSLQATCRIIAMIGSDYNGRAAEILRENLGEEEYWPPRGNDALEFRTYFCIVRWIGSAMMSMSLEGDVEQLYNEVQYLNKNAFGSPLWAATHARRAELQSLHIVNDVIHRIVNQKYSDKKNHPPTEYLLRSDMCPVEYTDYLLKKNGK